MLSIIRNLFLTAIILAASVGGTFAQNNRFANPYAGGILPAVTPIKRLETTLVTMNLGNNGASPIPADGASWNISFTSNILPDLSSIFLDGAPLTLTSFVDGGVTYVKLTVSGDGIPGKTGPGIKTSYNITINVTGTKVGGPTAMILNAVNEPSIAQNLSSGDDNATGRIEVIENFPVKLVSFSALKEGLTAQLSWETTEEVNADYFDIQRSPDAKDWTSIGQKQAAGESKALVKYTFTDAKPLAATSYYRLKMVDKDNTFAFSSIKNLEFDGKAQSLSVYPNPVSDFLFLKDEAGASLQPKDVKEVRIMNLNGETVYKTESLSNTSFATAGISVSSLANGTYVVKVTKVNGQVSSHKIVVTK